MLHFDQIYSRKIKSLLVAHGITMQKVADSCGVTLSTVSMVISRRSRSAKIERKIANMLRLPVKELFPDHKSSNKKPRRAS